MHIYESNATKGSNNSGFSTTHTQHTPFGGRTPSRIIYAHILCIFPNVAHFAFPSFLRRICIPFLLTHSQCRPMPKTQNRFAPESMQQSVKHAKGRHTDWCFNPKTTRPLTHKRLSLTHTRIHTHTHSHTQWRALEMKKLNLFRVKASPLAAQANS